MASPRIVIVEDEVLSGIFLQESLRERGYVVPAVASSDDELMRGIGGWNPDLVLMDIMLNGSRDGIDTAEQITARYDIPVIYLTAHTDPDTVHRAKLTKPYGFLVKPVNISELYIAVEFGLYRHGMEKKLRISEERYRAIVESMPVLICRYLPGDCVITFVNDEYCRYYNLRREYLVGRSLLDFFPETDRRIVRERVESLNRNNPLVTYERLVDTHAGQRWQRWTDQALFDEQGNVSEYQSIGQDITERIQFEDLIRESERKYRLLADNMLDLVSMCDAQARFTYVSPSYRIILGYSEEDLLGRPVYCLVHPDDLPEIMASIDRHRKDLMSASAVFRMNHKDGRTLWFETYGKVLVGDNGKPLGAVFSTREITDRKIMEDSLIMAHKQLQDIIDFLPDATFVIDREKKVIAWNRAVEKMTGVTKDAIMGKGDYVYAVPFYGERRPILIDLVGMDTSSYRKHYIKLHKEEETIFAETLVPSLPSTGKEIYLWGKASPLYDGYNNIIGAIQTVRDITEIKRIEIALRESEEKFRLLFEKSADAQLLMDGRRIIDCNTAAVGMLGSSSKEEILGKSPDELSPELQPNGISSAIQMDEILSMVYELDSLSFEWVHLGFDGRQVPVDITMTIIPIAGRLMIHAVLKNITLRKLAKEALRRSEQKYRMLVETMNDGLVQGDELGNITFTNDRFCEMVGYPKNEIIGRSIFDFMHEDSRENFGKGISGKRYGGKRHLEIVLRAKSDATIDTIVSPQFLIDEQSRVSGIVAVFTDITDRKHLERRVLEISMKEQQRIGRDLHDDLGQILTGTGFLCESLIRKLSNKKLPEAEEASGIFLLINEAKEHTRLLSRGLSPVEIDSGGIIAALSRLAETVESVFSVSCRLICDTSITINDSMVETQFHYIVQESLTNAIRHGKAKHIKVSLHNKKGQIHLAISDDGIGIPADIDSLKGMGLRIMRYRAAAIGASIRVAKNRGSGTTVSCVWRQTAACHEKRKNIEGLTS